MKFCYLDESGTGEEPYAIMAAVIVDSQRMHVTKEDWQNLLNSLSNLTKKQIYEFHTRDFYNGNGPWRGLDGKMRSDIITEILKWIRERKHKLSFNGIDKELYKKNLKTDGILKEFKSLWCMLGLHQILIIQKAFQNEEKNKGNTVFIFDNEVKEETRFGELIKNPPDWTDNYYNRGKKQGKLDQVIDVPYYGDSRDVNLLQIADLIAYLLRKYVELKEGKAIQKYENEIEKIDEWVTMILDSSLSKSSRYPNKRRDSCTEVFYKYAPQSLRSLG